MVSSHVLEHIKDPSEPLKYLISTLKPRGLAILMIPINKLLGEDLDFFWYSTVWSIQVWLKV